MGPYQMPLIFGNTTFTTTISKPALVLAIFVERKITIGTPSVTATPKHSKIKVLRVLTAELSVARNRGGARWFGRIYE